MYRGLRIERHSKQAPRIDIRPVDTPMHIQRNLECTAHVASPWSTGAGPNGGGMDECFLMPMTRCHHVFRVSNREDNQPVDTAMHVLEGLGETVDVAITVDSRTQWLGV